MADKLKTPEKVISFGKWVQDQKVSRPNILHEAETGVQIAARLARSGIEVTGILLSTKTGFTFTDGEAKYCLAEALSRSAALDHGEITAKTIWK